MEALLRNTDSTSITTMFAKSGPTCFSPQGTARTLDHWVGPVGIHHIVRECRVLLEHGTQTPAHSRRALPRPHADPLDTTIHTTTPEERDSHITARGEMGPSSGCRLPAERRQTGGNFESSGQFIQESKTEIRGTTRGPGS